MKKLKCIDCDRTFDDNRGLSAHRRFIHPDNGVPDLVPAVPTAEPGVRFAYCPCCGMDLRGMMAAFRTTEDL